jgi:hypothetical protein
VEGERLGSLPVAYWPGELEDAPADTVLVWSEGPETAVGWRRRHLVFTARTVRGEWPAAVRSRLEAAVEPGGATPAAMDAAFDADALAGEFCQELRALIGEFESAVALHEPLRDAEHPHNILSVESRFLVSVLARVLTIVCLQEKGWFVFNGRTDYAEALHEDSCRRPNSMSFMERIGRLYLAGIHQPEREGWGAVESVLGSVAYMGPPFDSPAHVGQYLVLPETPGSVPAELFERVFGEDGIVRRYPLRSSPPRAFERKLNIDLELLSYTTDALRSARPIGERESIRWRCRSEVASFLGVSPEIASLREDWLDRLAQFHVIEARTGFGEYLVAMLHELVELKLRLMRARGEKAVSPVLVAQETACTQLHGYATDPVYLFFSRVRIAFACWTWDSGELPAPRPPIEESIRLGLVAGLFPERRGMGFVEDRVTELKAAWEWNSVRGERDPALRAAVLRTVCAFLNTDGGTIYLGVSDDGRVVGIGDDLRLHPGPNPYDSFEAQIRQQMKETIDPVPLDEVVIQFTALEGRTLCTVRVSPRAGVTYYIHRRPSGGHDEEVYVRDGNRTLRLTGRLRDQFVVRRYASGHARPPFGLG